jgi:hypothetical protein
LLAPAASKLKNHRIRYWPATGKKLCFRAWRSG